MDRSHRTTSISYRSRCHFSLGWGLAKEEKEEDCVSKNFTVLCSLHYAQFSPYGWPKKMAALIPRYTLQAASKIITLLTPFVISSFFTEIELHERCTSPIILKSPIIFYTYPVTVVSQLYNQQLTFVLCTFQEGRQHASRPLRCRRIIIRRNHESSKILLPLL